jgi:hypothetical protein
MIEDQKPELNPVADFLAAHGGPFYELQERLGLLQQSALRSGRRSLIFVGLAWGVPLLLCLAAGTLWNASHGLPYLLDTGPWAKFFFAIAAFTLAERQIEEQLHQKLGRAFTASIVAPASVPDGAQAVNIALRRRNAPVAEVVCLVIAVVASSVAYRHLLHVDHASWAVATSPGGNSITLAGWWSLLISLPLFWFLALRGLWRHFVWSLLLRSIAQLKLRLVSTHPDGRAGLGFVAEYPNAYVIFVFGVSCAVAASVGKNFLQEPASLSTFSTLMAGWLVVVLALFAFPLATFGAPLRELKKATLERLSTQATQYHRLAERKLTGSNVVADDASETEQFTDVADPSKQYDLTRKQSTMLMSRSAVVPVSAAALIPFAALAATQVPFKDVLSVVKKLLLL